MPAWSIQPLRGRDKIQFLLLKVVHGLDSRDLSVFALLLVVTVFSQQSGADAASFNLPGNDLTTKTISQPPSCSERDGDLFYHNTTDNTCQECPRCPAGKQPDRVCGEDGEGEGSVCEECPRLHYSTNADYRLCVPCRKCENTVGDEKCKSSNDAVCGSCAMGYGYSHITYKDSCIDCTVLGPKLAANQETCKTELPWDMHDKTPPPEESKQDTTTASITTGEHIFLNTNDAGGLEDFNPITSGKNLPVFTENNDEHQMEHITQGSHETAGSRGDQRVSWQLIIIVSVVAAACIALFSTFKIKKRRATQTENTNPPRPQGQVFNTINYNTTTNQVTTVQMNPQSQNQNVDNQDDQHSDQADGESETDDDQTNQSLLPSGFIAQQPESSSSTKDISDGHYSSLRSDQGHNLRENGSDKVSDLRENRSDEASNLRENYLDERSDLRENDTDERSNSWREKQELDPDHDQCSLAVLSCQHLKHMD